MTLETPPHTKFRTLKDGSIRGRFDPSPRLRKLGYKSFDYLLGGHPFTAQQAKAKGFTDALPVTRTGQPATIEESLTIGHDILAMIETPKAEASAKSAPIRILRPARAIDLATLIDDYLQSDAYRLRLNPSTQNDYKRRLMQCVDYFGGHRRPGDIDEVEIERMFWSQKKQRGHRSAFGMFAYLRIVYNWGRRQSKTWKPYMPDIEWAMGIPAPRGRVRIATEAEQAALMRAADDPLSIYAELGLSGPAREVVGKSNKTRAIEPTAPMHAVGDAIQHMFWTAQRPSTVLRMKRDWLYTDDDGALRMTVFPEKTKRYATKVDFPILPPLAARQAEMAARHLARGWTSRPNLILSDARGVPMINDAATQTKFTQYYAKVRRLAARLEPSCADLNFQDFRDTAITNLHLAGCNKTEIRSFSNHKSDKSLDAVLGKHYGGGQKEFADRAGEKLMKHFKG